MKYICYTAYNTEERINNIENHLKKILPDLIVLKSEGEVSIKNAKLNYCRALELVSDTGGILVEDDIKLPDNFIEVSNEVIESHKNDVVSFYRWSERRLSASRYSSFLGNQCVYFPKDICKKHITKYTLTEFIKNKNAVSQYDALTGLWLVDNGIQVWFVQPNIIEHLDFHSTIGNPYELTH